MVKTYSGQQTKAQAQATQAHDPNLYGSLGIYYKDISGSTPLSPQEEVELSTRIRKGDAKARDELAEANLKFVVQVAREYQTSGLALEELISAGNYGLLKAAERFDGTKGFKFISYAVWWIRQAIQQEIHDQTGEFRLSVNRLDLLDKIRKTPAESCLNTSGYFRLTSEDLATQASQLGVTPETLEDTLILAQKPVYLDAPLRYWDNHRTPLDSIPDTSSLPTEASMLESSSREDIEKALETLKPREADILKLYFGWNDEEPLTLEEIGLRFKLTRERIRQIKEKALTQLYHRAKDLKKYLE